jgi:hypothetical protein
MGVLPNTGVLTNHNIFLQQTTPAMNNNNNHCKISA